MVITDYPYIGTQHLLCNFQNISDALKDFFFFQKVKDGIYIVAGLEPVIRGLRILG